MNEKDSDRKQILLRLTPSLWKELARWAEDDFRSLNSQIEYILHSAVSKRKNTQPDGDPDTGTAQ